VGQEGAGGRETVERCSTTTLQGKSVAALRSLTFLSSSAGFGFAAAFVPFEKKNSGQDQQRERGRSLLDITILLPSLRGEGGEINVIYPVESEERLWAR